MESLNVTDKLKLIGLKAGESHRDSDSSSAMLTVDFYMWGVKNHLRAPFLLGENLTVASVLLMVTPWGSMLILSLTLAY